MTPEIIEMAPMRVATVRHVGPYHTMQPAFQRLGEEAGRAGLFNRQNAMMMGIYHDALADTPEGELRSDAALTVEDEIELPDGLQEQWLPAGRFARVVHKGSYAGLPDAWSTFLSRLQVDGHRLRDAPCYDVYENTPGELSEGELRTVLYAPIE